MIGSPRKYILITCFLILIFPLSVLSQNDGDALFNSKQYAKAKIVYENLLKQNQNNILNNYRYARCCYELKENDLAIQHFEKAGTRYALRNFYLGELYFYAYRFDESIRAYNDYLETLDPNDNRIATIESNIKKSELGAKLLNRVEDIAIVDSTIVNKNDFLNFYKYSKELGKLQHNRIRLKDQTVHDRIIYTTERGDRLFFSDTTKSNIDIFSSIKLLDEWSKPTAISSVINTPANESYPFLLLDGVTLYYASDSEGSLGGYDIFMTRFSANSKSYLQPENIGMPFNSPYNDYMMVIDELNKTGWFATDRHQLDNKVMIYQFVLNDPKIYFRSQDSIEQSQVARLIKYRKAKNTHKKNLQVAKTETVDNLSETKDFIMVINDSTYYNQLEQIQSDITLAKVKEWLSLQEIQTQRKLELETMRNDYAKLENQEETIKLHEKISVLEKLYFETDMIMKNKLIEAANEEIKFIRIN
jgi:tetratricopeptide (TPR) repeat protein